MLNVSSIEYADGRFTISAEGRMIMLSDTDFEAMRDLRSRMRTEAEHQAALDRADAEWGTPEVRARRGAEFLDIIEPGWANRITSPALDLRNPRKCILGQVYKGRHGVNHTTGWAYAHANVLPQGNPDEHARRMGFTPGPMSIGSGGDMEGSPRSADNHRLVGAWIAEITARLDRQEAGK